MNYLKKKAKEWAKNVQYWKKRKERKQRQENKK